MTPTHSNVRDARTQRRRIAPRTAKRFADSGLVAARLGVEVDWVIAHARQHGGVRMGGPGGRVRFDLRNVERCLTCPQVDKQRLDPSR